VARIAEIMDAVQPDTVLTFGPDGMTGHDDHKCACRWTTEAFGQVGKVGASLHYATNTPEWLARYREPLDEHNVFMGAEPPCTPADELSIGEIFTGELLDQKLAAIRSMTSQVEPLIEALGEDFFREGMAEESFRRA
jgi:LmbE family N-acetylglucosaminyl deacetylase